MAERILVIEDHPDIVEIIRHHLENEGYDLEVATDGVHGFQKAISRPPSLILLDLMLPKMDGLEVCRKLRGRPEIENIPIIMLTAKGEKSDIVKGLEVGADDYVTKPFSPKELSARIRAVLRRSTSKIDKPKEYMKAGDLSIDVSRHEVRLEKESLKLTLTEFALLRTLLMGRGRIFTRDQLINKVRGEDVVIVDRNVDVHISALRKKLKHYGNRILTIRGVGYRFQE